MRLLLAILMVLSPILGWADELTVQVPKNNPVYTLIEIDSTGGGLLTVIDKNGKVHSAYKCDDKYLFTGPPNEYLITYLKYDGEWKVVNEPFSIRDGGGDDPGDPGDPVSYREAIQRVIPSTEDPFDLAKMYVGFRLGSEKLAEWGDEAITKQAAIANDQADITSSPEAWRAFVVAWSDITSALPPTKWSEAWTTTSDLLNKTASKTKSDSSANLDTSENPTVHLASYTPPTTFTRTQSPLIKSGGVLSQLGSGTTKQNDSSTVESVPAPTLSPTIPQSPQVMPSSKNSAPSPTPSYSENTEDCLPPSNKQNVPQVQTVQVQQVLPSTHPLCQGGALKMCDSGQTVNSTVYPSRLPRNYIASPLSCGTQYVVSECNGMQQRAVPTCTNMQAGSMAGVECSPSNTYRVGARQRVRWLGRLIPRNGGQVRRGLFSGRLMPMNWGTVSASPMCE